MQSHMRFLALAVALLSVGCSRIISHGTAASPTSVITEENVRRLLTGLAADSMEGRAVGSPGEKRAARLIASEMAAMRLEPAGDSGFFQRVPLASRTVMMPQRDSLRRYVVRNGDTVRVATQRLIRLASFADWDTIPVERRRMGVNVLGVLRGSDPVLRDSAVLVDAHFDHLGIRTPVAGDSIYNGADDDASGTVAVLEIARALRAGPRPKRTIIFATTTGEEAGLLGTNWYIAHPVVPLARMTANLEIEMIGRPDSLAGGAGRGWLTGDERSTMGAMFREAGLPIGPDPRPEQRFYQRSDNIAFARAGIVAHTLSSFNLHTDYHRPSDASDKVDIAHMTQLIGVGAAAVRLLADGPSPEWKPGGQPAQPVRAMP
jgi:hypothetical protein